MRGYKTIDQFDIQECKSFLKDNPDSPFCDEVREREQSLIELKRQQEQEQEKKRVADYNEQEKAKRGKKIRIIAGIIVIIVATLITIIVTNNTDQNEDYTCTIPEENSEITTEETEEVVPCEACETPAEVSVDEVAVVDTTADDTENTETDVTFFANSVITDIIYLYGEAVSNNNFSELRTLYANYIDRYHSKYNTTIDYVIDAHKRYDEKFGVYGKQFDVKWETLNVTVDNSEGKAYVSIIMDYRIDRYDTSKKTHFILRKHFVINHDHKIIEEYDDIIESE